MEMSTIENTYGYIWSDWLYYHDKDRFMVDVHNDCKRIDECVDTIKKATLLTLLKEKVQHSKKSWVEGIIDFIGFEESFLSLGKVPLEILQDNQEYHLLSILDGAYHHGAFRGLCRTASGEEWIGFMGEWCAAAMHQGLKWMRLKKVSEWELPSLGEAWCKGTAIWSLVCMYIILNDAGDNADNDQIIARIYAVIGAHHMAGILWQEYRGEHPHRWFNSAVRPLAPSQQAIRRFGEKQAYPTIMIDIMCRAAAHVNEWINPPFDAIHLPRTRGLIVADHTPRLKARLYKLCDEMIAVAGDMTTSEVQEFQWRTLNWMTSYSTQWRGRGDCKDAVLEITNFGALLGVLRESRDGSAPDLVPKIVGWSAQRLQHLSPEQQEAILSLVKRTAEMRGGVSRKGYSSTGLGPTRFLDGVWTLSILLLRTVTPGGSPEFPPTLMPLAIQLFHETKGFQRIKGVDIPPEGDDAYDGCPVCLRRDLFVAMVDNRPGPEVFHVAIWGSLIYNNLGLGLPDDVSLGCVNHE